MSNWYERSFGEDYLRIYRHRDRHEAYQQVGRMIGWLKLPVGSHVLDLCCGAGRHALALAEAGFRMTGIDLSGCLLNEAQKADKKRQITWIKSDMRRLPEEPALQGSFDAVVNLFTSFGYFEEDGEQLKVLQQIHKALKPQGKYMIDLLNEEYVKEHLVPFSQREVDGITISETRRLHNGFVEKEIHVEQVGAPSRRYWERVKLYTLPLMKNLLHAAGLRMDQVYGDYQEKTYHVRQSPRMIVIGQRE
ncbi:class I SAM-dependent methyltransferase [Cohnella hongkongensis]|uniref:Class I SAM-dependent methyltransferase n=1 Tax=Cohnella hongkongensis TaxID=178337 RepID=A0ABV9FNS2_9BACL